MCNHVCCSASGVAHSIIAAVPLALLSSPARLRSISNYFEIKFQFWRRTMTKIYLSISSNVWIFCHQSECLKVLKTNYFIIYGISFRCSCIFALVSEQWRCNYENSRQVFFPRAVCAQVSLTGDFLYLKTQRKSFHHMKKNANKTCVINYSGHIFHSAVQKLMSNTLLSSHAVSPPTSANEHTP